MSLRPIVDFQTSDDHVQYYMLECTFQHSQTLHRNPELSHGTLETTVERTYSDMVA